MKLFEIIAALENPENSVLIEKMIPYKKALMVYYSDLFGCEPVLMVVSVSNAAQYARIEPSNEFSEAVFAWVESSGYDNEEERENEEETINFNSVMLSQL